MASQRHELIDDEEAVLGVHVATDSDDESENTFQNVQDGEDGERAGGVHPAKRLKVNDDFGGQCNFKFANISPSGVSQGLQYSDPRVICQYVRRSWPHLLKAT